MTQVGFARVISDRDRFAWIAEFFVIESTRGKGLGTALLKCVLESPACQVRRLMVRCGSQSKDLINFLRLRAGMHSIVTELEPKLSCLIKNVQRSSDWTKKTEWVYETHPEYFASTDRALLDPDDIYGYLRTMYWANKIRREQVETEVKNSACIGVYRREQSGTGRSGKSTSPKGNFLIRISRARWICQMGNGWNNLCISFRCIHKGASRWKRFRKVPYEGRLGDGGSQPLTRWKFEIILFTVNR